MGGNLRLDHLANALRLPGPQTVARPFSRNVPTYVHITTLTYTVRIHGMHKRPIKGSLSQDVHYSS